jgi:hypothetical protein
MSVAELAGNWTYRSFHNNPKPVTSDAETALSLFFAEADFWFEAVSDVTFRGVIDWGSGGLDLSGTIRRGSEDTPIAFAITGVGRPGTQTDGWEYRYNGCLAHKWPAGVNQVPALVGSVIRAKPHGSAPAGYVASFVAVKKI